MLFLFYWTFYSFIFSSRKQSGYHIAFYSCLYIVSFDLPQYLNFSSFFIFLTVWENIRYFCRTPLNLCLSDIFSWLDWGNKLLEEYPRGEVPSSHDISWYMISAWLFVVILDLASRLKCCLPARFFHHKASVFHFHSLCYLNETHIQGEIFIYNLQFLYMEISPLVPIYLSIIYSITYL